MSESDYLDATARAQRVLAGEEAPPVEIVTNLGISIDVSTGAIFCGRCGLDALALVGIIAFPHALSPELAATRMRCRSCGTEQAITLEREGGGVRLTTKMQGG